MKPQELRQLIREEIQKLNGVGEFSWVDIRETQILGELNYNLKNTYEITNELPFNIEFRDNKNRLNITKGKLNNGFIEIKLYWIDEFGKPRMDSPENVLPITMNTHLFNIINKFLPNYDKFLIRPNDDIRFRLFQLLLNKYIDERYWDMRLFPSERIIHIIKNHETTRTKTIN